jgi:heme exporter protein C
MWWKILSVLLICYALIAGLLVPLKPGIQRADPSYAKLGKSVKVTFEGYNTIFTRNTGDPLRVWLTLDESHSIAGRDLQAIDDMTLKATFDLPAQLPEGKRSALLNVIVDHPESGTALLPSGIEVSQDTFQSAAQWTNTVSNLHVRKGFSFPYQNVIYESIRNTYYHVPMWFALMFLFLASVIYSVRYLMRPDPELDRRAFAYTELGVAFGLFGLFTGMVWANYTWGAPWNNDIKQLMTAVALLIYMAYFILRRSFDEPEKGARLGAVYNIFAFASLIPLLYIVPRMFASLHPGATGNPAFGSQDLDNTMRMVFYPAIIGWTLLGFWMAQLRFRYQRLVDKMLD